MSAWGYHTFENDNALDWVKELARTKALTQVTKAIDVAVRRRRRARTTADSCTVLAAAEVVAALHGYPAAVLPTHLKRWLAGKPALGRSVVRSSASAVSAILENSELKKLWAETPDFQAWEARVIDLRTRLQRAANETGSQWAASSGRADR